KGGCLKRIPPRLSASIGLWNSAVKSVNHPPQTRESADMHHRHQRTPTPPATESRLATAWFHTLADCGVQSKGVRVGATRSAYLFGDRQRQTVHFTDGSRATLVRADDPHWDSALASPAREGTQAAAFLADVAEGDHALLLMHGHHIVVHGSGR